MTDKTLEEFTAEHRAMIAVAEACWRDCKPSYSWHVFDWMAWKLRRKYPLLRLSDDRAIDFDAQIF